MKKKILYLGLNPTRYSQQEEIVHWPIIKIVRRSLREPTLQRALCLFENYTHILVTSQSTVDILSDYLPSVGISSKKWRKAATLAVGQATASHLKAIGIPLAAVAQEETAEGLIAAFQKIMPKTLDRAVHIFWPHSSQARPIIKNFLLENAIRYTDCDLYDPLLNIPGELPILESFHEIVFTSPSTVDAFLEVFKTFPPHAKLTSIGPITANRLKQLSIFFE